MFYSDECGNWNTKIHVLGVKVTYLKGFILSGGEENDAPEGYLLLETVGKQKSTVPVLIDRAYADFKCGFQDMFFRMEPVL